MKRDQDSRKAVFPAQGWRSSSLEQGIQPTDQRKEGKQWMKVYHIERNTSVSLEAQKKQIRQEYANVTEMICVQHHGIRYIMVFAD